MENQGLFKKLTLENWLDIDPGCTQFVSVKPDGTSQSISATDWAGKILAIEMPEAVPQDVKNIFDVARGTLCYGCYFYPLYTLGSEQCFRVLEAALRHKCRDLGAPERVRRRFGGMVDWLVTQGIIRDEQRVRWDAARRLRNMASHPERQSIKMPTMAVHELSIAVEMTTSLFPLDGNMA